MDIDSGVHPAPLPNEEGIQLSYIGRKRSQSILSTLSTRRQLAVCVRNAHKTYGYKSSPNVILEGLHMTVPKGVIYGLLGASGCGKTTLLTCIVGRRRLNSGEIWVLGGKPGSKGSGVPGPRIGYMPQEVALYGEFTIEETLRYFGWIYGMTSEKIEERTNFLVKLLQLPYQAEFVKNLSGGQQRRMSLAAALLNNSELLILDEPTVGLDPLLRQTLWNHFVDITKNGSTTIIITTHYIDETRQAHLIGLMRGGRFLAEESPDELLRHHNSDSLEGVFLKLAIIQNSEKPRRASVTREAISNPAFERSVEDVNANTSDPSPKLVFDGISDEIAAGKEIEDSLPIPPEEPTPKESFIKNFQFIKSNNMKALIWKNYLWMVRNVGPMLFVLGLPVTQVVLFCWAIGHDPFGLKVAIVNNELDVDFLKTVGCPTYSGCNYTNLSCKYLKTLGSKGVIYEYYREEEEAFQRLKGGYVWGSIFFASNYSQALVNRVDNGFEVEAWDLEAANMVMTLDMSDQRIGTLLFRSINNAYNEFNEEILKDCDYNPLAGRIPIQWNDPIYGDREPNFTDFVAPGFLLTTTFFISLALTAGAMLIEKNEGMLERCLVSGITPTEILFSHLCTQFTVVACQELLLLIFSFVIFDLTNRGNMLWIVCLLTLTGVCGMCYGFLISSYCDKERTACYIGLGSFNPTILLCGIIWPVEGMHPVLQMITVYMPLTKSTESLRSILQRGWEIDRQKVYMGYISTTVWIVIFLSLSLIVLKFKKA